MNLVLADQSCFWQGELKKSLKFCWTLFGDGPQFQLCTTVMFSPTPRNAWEKKEKISSRTSLIRLEISWDVTPETFASGRRTDGRDQVDFVMLSLQSRPRPSFPGRTSFFRAKGSQYCTE